MSCGCLCRIPWSQMLSRECRCSWSSAPSPQWHVWFTSEQRTYNRCKPLEVLFELFVRYLEESFIEYDLLRSIYIKDLSSNRTCDSRVFGVLCVFIAYVWCYYWLFGIRSHTNYRACTEYTICTTYYLYDADSKVYRATWGPPGADRTQVGPISA